MKPKISFSNNSELTPDEIKALAPKPVVAKRNPGRPPAQPKPSKEVSVSKLIFQLSEEEQELLQIKNELALARAKKEREASLTPRPPNPIPPPVDDDKDDGPDFDDDWGDDDDDGDGLLIEDDDPNDDFDDEPDDEPLLEASAKAVSDAATTADLAYQVYGDSTQYSAALNFVKAMQALNLAVRDMVATRHTE